MSIRDLVVQFWSNTSECARVLARHIVCCVVSAPILLYMHLHVVQGCQTIGQKTPAPMQFCLTIIWLPILATCPRAPCIDVSMFAHLHARKLRLILVVQILMLVFALACCMLRKVGKMVILMLLQNYTWYWRSAPFAYENTVFEGMLMLEPAMYTWKKILPLVFWLACQQAVVVDANFVTCSFFFVLTLFLKIYSFLSRLARMSK